MESEEPWNLLWEEEISTAATRTGLESRLRLSRHGEGSPLGGTMFLPAYPAQLHTPLWPFQELLVPGLSPQRLVMLKPSLL